jgi:cytosine deaminase
MYTTLSPCDMCTGAILLYGIPRAVMGENRSFVGGGTTFAREASR